MDVKSTKTILEMLYPIIAAVVSLIAGLFVGKAIFAKETKKIEEEATAKAADIVKTAELQAENIKKDRVLEAKEKFLKLRSEFEDDSNRKKQILVQNEQKLKERERTIQLSMDDAKKSMDQAKLSVEQAKKMEMDVMSQRQSLTSKEENLRKKTEEAEKKQAEADEMFASQVAQLEKIAGLTAIEARQQLIQAMTAEAETKASSMIKTAIEEAKLTATKEAKKVVIETIQRTAAENAIENCVSVFNIESDDVKGKIIGREGRNIRALEAATGVEFIVDDTPEAIIISGFDPVRREIARLSLHRLVQDGRIHPARIEEVVAKTKKNIDDEIVEIGERTVIDLGIHGLHPELIKMVGRMRFRSSYGQNLLQHSREVAKLCATMAAELGLNAKAAKRAGLLHDIGKVWHEEAELPHAILGMQLAEKYKENAEICNAIGAHHDEIEMTSMISPIIQVCDAISGSRPGARREMMESYMRRLKELEELAVSFQGVQKCYAIQAGRELRVLVDAENVTDEKASSLSFDISQKIEKEMQYPGQIKVTVIREMRAVNYAK